MVLLWGALLGLVIWRSFLSDLQNFVLNFHLPGLGNYRKKYSRFFRSHDTRNGIPQYSWSIDSKWDGKKRFGGLSGTLRLNYKILYLKTYTSTEANQLFGYNAQTPLCYVIFKKRENIYQSIKFNLFDNSINDFVSFSLLKKGLCIPTNHAQFIDNMNYKWWTNKKYNIEKTLARTLIKTCNMNKECIEGRISDWDEDEDQSIYSDGYKIVTGAKLRKRKSNDFDDCRLMGFIGKKPGAYYGIPKIIIAHKRLPWVTLDLKGDLSFYGRDKYCFIFPDMFENPKEKEKMMKNQRFL